MNYYRKPINRVIDDVKLKMQLSALTLKLSENNKKIDDLIVVDKNIKKDVSSNTSKIGDNKSDISTNSGLISTNTGAISTNSSQISTNTSSISTNSNQLSTNTSSISTNSGQISTNEGNISSNLSKITNIENNLIIVNDIYNETFVISRFSSTWSNNRIFYRIINSKFTTNGIIKIDAKYNYVYDENYTLSHVYRFFNNKRQFRKIILDHDRSSNVINDKFEIQGIDSTEIEIAIYFENNTDNKKITLVGNNTIQINYIETNSKLDMNKNNISANLKKINDNSDNLDTNTNNISSNLEKINDNSSNIASNLLKINENTDDITALQTSNIKAFYNLDKIFIYDIEKGYQTVNKDNHYHIFEKEITYNFIKNSYLEIILKVLTEISNYILIGFFQILCNFYNQGNNLFYTISLSTAMGSINKLSTVKSVFIVPINENMSKIKIDLFIAPKETQQNRSATFTIKDINSNKIYVKYYQKTDEMSIKDIKDSLNNVKDISNDLKQINDSIKLKNIKNILFYDVRDQINFKGLFFNKTFELNIKKNDFIEFNLRILLDYENIKEAHIVITEFKLYNDNDEQIYISTYNNGDSISYKNFVFINKHIFYNFEKDTKNLKIIIEFRMTKVEVIKIWYEPKNLDRFILKHYGN